MADIDATLTKQKPNRMARRRLETRQKLLNATLELVVENGVEKTTMSHITDRADLGRRTFYYHFTSKDEAVIAAVADLYQQHAIRIAQAIFGKQDPVLTMAMASQAVTTAILKEPVTPCLVDYPKLLGEALFKALGNAIHLDIATGIASGDFHPPIRTDFLESMMKWSLVGVIIRAVEFGDDISDILKEFSQMSLLVMGVESSKALSIVNTASEKIHQLNH